MTACGRLFLLVLTAMLFVCQGCLSSGDRAGGAWASKVIQLAPVALEPRSRDLSFSSLATSEAVWVREPILSVRVASARLVPDGLPGEGALLVTVVPGDAELLRQWTTENQGSKIAILLGAGVVTVVTLRTPLDNRFFVSLHNLSVPHQLWLIERLTGERLTVGELREALPAHE